MEDSGPALSFHFCFLWHPFNLLFLSFKEWAALNISPGFPQFHMLTWVGSAESGLFTSVERSQGVAHRDALTLHASCSGAMKMMQNADVWVYFLSL